MDQATPGGEQSTAGAPGERHARLRARLARATRLAPWASLAMGGASVAVMDRSPSRAGLVAAAAVGGWVVLGLVGYLRRVPAPPGGRRALLHRAAQFSSVAAVQWAVQLTLFFALPFYLRAAAVGIHAGFVGLLLLAAALSLWDPVFVAIARVAVASLTLQALASFSALGVVLPILGLSNQTSLWVAAVATAVGLPLATGLASEAQARRRSALKAGAVGLALPIGLLLGAGRLVPAAPLRLVSLEIGGERTGPGSTGPVPPDATPVQLVCATAIWAPRGLRDGLFHVWEKDGVELAAVPLEVKGGREQGFRTWSVKKNLGGTPWGSWTCTVRTASGQVLGAKSIELAGPDAEETAAPPVADGG